MKSVRTLDSMHKKFRWISNESHLQRLREFEAADRVKEDRQGRLSLLSTELAAWVKESIDNGISLHDVDIQQKALLLNATTYKIENFVSSGSWIDSFKKRNNIVSRKVTKFISRVSHQNIAVTRALADSFVANVRKEIVSGKYMLPEIWNADQSGFNKELTTARTLAYRGQRTVQRIVQSASALTHSYTVLPMLNCNGVLAEKLYVVLQEPGGTFPQAGYFQTKNLIVRANTSHIMNKDLMKDWFQNVVFANPHQKKMLLLVDSWSSFKDTALIHSLVPQGLDFQIQHIPAGATPMIQPLDVYGFGPLKKFVKRINAYAVTHRIDFKISARDSLLKVISLTYRQFSHPVFQPLWEYGWYAAGYHVLHPAPFKTPSQLCFPTIPLPCALPNCQAYSFITCLYCNKQYCFLHYVNDYHWC